MAFGVGVVASAAVWWACGSSSAGGGGVPDGGEAADVAMDLTMADGSACDPCSQICACMPGETFDASSQCMTYTCPPTGVWGILGCTDASACVDASNEQSPAMDATTEAADAEAATDAQPDAPSDVVHEAAEASEASGD